MLLCFLNSVCTFKYTYISVTHTCCLCSSDAAGTTTLCRAWTHLMGEPTTASDPHEHNYIPNALCASCAYKQHKPRPHKYLCIWPHEHGSQKQWIYSLYYHYYYVLLNLFFFLQIMLNNKDRKQKPTPVIHGRWRMEIPRFRWRVWDSHWTPLRSARRL